MSKLDLVSEWIAGLAFVAVVLFSLMVGFIVGESLDEREGRAKERKHNAIQNFVVSTNSQTIRTLRADDFCLECLLKIEKFYGKPNIK